MLGGCNLPVLVWHGDVHKDDGSVLGMGERSTLLARHEAPILVPLDGSAFAEHALAIAAPFTYLARVKDQIVRRGVPVMTITVMGPVFDVLAVFDATRRAVRATVIVPASHALTGSLGPAPGGVAARLIEE